MEHPIDAAFISFMEMKKNDVHFKRVDSDISEILKDDEGEKDKEVNSKETETLLNIFKKVLAKEDLKLQLESLKEEEIPAIVILSEDSRRMQEMMKRYAMSGMEGMDIPSEETLVLNKKNTIIKYLIENAGEETELMKIIPQHIYDLAMLSHKPLSPEQMSEFIKRSNDLLNRMI